MDYTRGALLDHVSKLVRQQPLTFGRLRRILSRAEHDVMPHRIGERM